MVKPADIKRGEVYWVNLDPTIGTEIHKTRPALIISPDDMNAALPRDYRAINKPRTTFRLPPRTDVRRQTSAHFTRSNSHH